MLTHHHTHEDSIPQPDSSVEPEVHEPVAADSSVISFKVNRQMLIVSALAILLAISAFETIELTRLHRVFDIYQTVDEALESF